MNRTNTREEHYGSFLNGAYGDFVSAATYSLINEEGTWR